MVLYVANVFLFQMTQALSSHVGCAIKRCYGSVWDVYYVCNYAYL